MFVLIWSINSLKLLVDESTICPTIFWLNWHLPIS